LTERHEYAILINKVL